jgi:hypothetical protein
MNIPNRLFKLIWVYPVILLSLVFALHLWSEIPEQNLYPVLLAFLLTTLNFFAGTITSKIALKKSDKTFIKIVFGGLTIRLFIMLGIVLFTLVFLDINLNSFIFSIFIFYIIYLIIEVFYLNFIKN